MHSDPKHAYVYAALLFLTLGCSGPSRRSAKKPSLPSLQELLGTARLGGLDLAKRASFDAAGRDALAAVNGVGGRMLGARFRAYEIRAESYGRLVLWPGKGNSTLGFAVRVRGKSKRVPDSVLSGLGLSRGKGIGFLARNAGIERTIVERTNREDSFVCGSFLIRSFEKDALKQLGFLDLDSERQRLDFLLNSGSGGELLAALEKYRNSESPELQALSKKLEQSRDAAIRSRVEAAKTKIAAASKRIQGAKIWDALRLYGRLEVDLDKLKDVDGRTLLTRVPLLKDAEQRLRARLSAAQSKAEAGGLPLRSAFFGSVLRLRIYDAAAPFQDALAYADQVEDPKDILNVESRLRHVGRRGKGATVLYNAVKGSLPGLLVQLLEKKLGSVKERSYVGIACKDLVFSARRGKELPLRLVSSLLTVCEKLDRAKTVLDYAPWARMREGRLPALTPNLQRSVAQRGSEIAEQEAKVFEERGKPLSAAARLLMGVAVGADRWPEPGKLEKYIDRTPRLGIHRARELVTPWAAQLLPHPSEDGRALVDMLHGPHAAKWPLLHGLGLDPVPVKSLVRALPREHPRTAQEEYLVPLKGSYRWKSRRRSALRVSQMSALSLDRLSAIFLSKETRALAKSLKERSKVLSKASKELDARTERFKADGAKLSKRMKAHQLDMQMGRIGRVAARRKTDALKSEQQTMASEGRALERRVSKWQSLARKYNEDLKVYQERARKERAKKSDKINLGLADATNRFIDERLAELTPRMKKDEADWLRWFFGRKTSKGARTIPMRLQEADGALAWEWEWRLRLCDEAPDVRRLGKAIAECWDRMLREGVRDRVKRLRPRVDAFVKRYGKDLIFTKMILKSTEAKTLLNELLTNAERVVVERSRKRFLRR